MSELIELEYDAQGKSPKNYSRNTMNEYPVFLQPLQERCPS